MGDDRSGAPGARARRAPTHGFLPCALALFAIFPGLDLGPAAAQPAPADDEFLDGGASGPGGDESSPFLPPEGSIDLARDPLAPLEAAADLPPGFAAAAEAARAARPFHRPEDLLRVPGADPEMLGRVRPFLAPAEAAAPLLGRLELRGRSAASGGTRWLESAAFRRGEGLAWGGVVERDPGERALSDHAAWWVAARAGGVALAAGAFDAEWGLGQVVSTASSRADPGAAVRRALRDGGGLSPRRGAGEEGEFRGAGAALSRWGASLSFLAARTRRDARISRAGTVTSLAGTGLHRTASERATRDRLLERTAGAAASIPLPFGARAGASVLTSALDPPLAPRTGSALPSGRFARAAGVHLLAPIGPLRIGAESAGAGGGNASAVAALAAAGGARVAFLARRHDAAYRSLHGAAILRRGSGRDGGGVTWLATARRGGVSLEAIRDAWEEQGDGADSGGRERGWETRLSGEFAREGIGLGARFRRRSGETLASARAAPRRTRRDALRLEAAFPAPGRLRISLRADGVAVGDAADADPGAVSRGGLLEAGAEAVRASGLRIGASLLAYSAGSGDAVPRTAKGLVPGTLVTLPFRASARPAGTCAILTVRRALGPSLAASAGVARHAPRGGGGGVDVAVSLTLGRAR